MTSPITYKDAGVNIDTGNAFVKAIAPLIKKTKRTEVLTGIGGFSGLFSINRLKYEEPVLVSSTDGIGTKLKLAIEMGIVKGLGQDLVAMCVNDILCSGAEPLFFLDYYATGKLELKQSLEIIKGMTSALADIHCALIGGETAEMPGVYKEGDFDLAGFAVGVVNRSDIIDGSSISIDNQVIGLESSGCHSNGYSLIRKIIEQAHLDLHKTYPQFEKKLGEVLVEPTRIYVNSVLHVKNHFNVLGISHITGGGLIENIPRILPEGCKVILKKKSWNVPPIFQFLQEKGCIDQEEMLRVFNCGIGMVLIVPKNEAEDILSMLQGLGQPASMIGNVEARKKGEPCVEFQ